MLTKFIKKCIPDQAKAAYYSATEFKRQLGYYPNLLAPTTFNEKLQAYKVFYKPKHMPQMQDKVLIKAHVQKLLGAGYVIPTLWHGRVLPPLSERNWPIPFVIKANHASGWNLFVTSEQACNWAEIEQKCDNWMNKVYGKYMGEWSYSKIKPQLLVEPFISEMAGMPVDYKIWVFNGKAKIVQVIVDRDTDHLRQAFYSLDWQKLPFNGKMFAAADDDFVPPKSLKQMLEASELLAKDCPFVRVDFYEINGKPLFGEMTFCPASGYSVIEPPEWDVKLGEMWQ